MLDDHTARSAGGRDDLDSGASSSGNNTSGNIIAGGGNGANSDDDDDDDGDGDGSIARLFSIGGLKRRMSAPESRQQVSREASHQRGITLEKGAAAVFVSYDEKLQEVVAARSVLPEVPSLC